MTSRAHEIGGQYKSLLRIWCHFTDRRKFQILILMVLLPIGGVAEVISLSAILPLLTILIQPDKVFQYEFISRLASALKVTTAEQLILPIVCLFITLAMISAVFRIWLLWIMTRVAYGCGADLCAKVFRTTLYQPYSKHISKNSSWFISGISGKVAGTANILQQLLILINAGVLSTLIVVGMFFVNPYIAAVSILGFSSFYITLSVITRERLQKNSAEIASQSERLIKSLQEGLGAIRDVLINNTQRIFTSAFEKADVALRNAQISNNVIAASPRFLVEAFAIMLITIIGFTFSKRPGGILEFLPILGMLVLASQRLLPAIQQIYAAWACIMGMQASLSDALVLLDQPMPDEETKCPTQTTKFHREIEAKSLYFQYDKNSKPVLDNISFKIAQGSKVGITGMTGSGKSTLLDILMGLLPTTSGELLVDGEAIGSENVGRWQKVIAHVPQNIYLTDASLAENIAFGVPKHEINMARVLHAADQAHISDFIEGLEGGYETLAGERGIRLSGGQKQRIGIARALYKESKVLMLDEATSALDVDTEKSVMDAIDSIGDDITIIIIAHRLITLEKCDLIFELTNGKLSVIRNCIDVE